MSDLHVYSIGIIDSLGDIWIFFLVRFQFLFIDLQTGLEKNIFGNHLVTLPPEDFRDPPPAFSSDPLKRLSTTDDILKNSSYLPDSIRDPSQPSSSTTNKEKYSNDAYQSLVGGVTSSVLSESDIVEIEGPNSVKTVSSEVTSESVNVDI